MKTYLVKVETEQEVNAESAEEAIALFYEEMNLSNDSIESYTTAEEIE